MTTILILAGLAGLFLGGEALVRGAVVLARRFGIPPMVIGLTLVGFGTSTPELVTSLEAALGGSPGIAVGNVVGSNIANILLILGLAALIRPIAVAPAGFRRDGAVLVAASLIALAPVLSGALGRGGGAALVALLLVYLTGTLLAERRRNGPAAEVYEAEAGAMGPDGTPAGRAWLYVAAGLAGVILGAKALIAGAVTLATALGVSETAIGLTLVAVGTSLPELATSAVAARRGQSAIAFGNVVGSNIFNILGILGATAIAAPLAIPPEIARSDIWVMLGATAVLVWAAVSGWRVTRAEGAAMLALYAGYAWIVLRPA